ncbi:MAG TPA: hypothetical protein VNO33_17970 [Kofleriaceae bacterium]|nr:hypothetical protein [Kofleriaceae bacterium]
MIEATALSSTIARRAATTGRARPRGIFGPGVNLGSVSRSDSERRPWRSQDGRAGASGRIAPAPRWLAACSGLSA